MRAALVALVLLGADGGTNWRFTNSSEPAHRLTHHGTYPDGGRLAVWMQPGDQLVPQPQTRAWAFTLERPDGGSQYVEVPAGTELYQVDGGRVDLEHPTGHVHCWHPSPLQHAIAHHDDEFCCHCAAERCISRPWPNICDGHGPRCAEPQLNLQRRRR